MALPKWTDERTSSLESFVGSESPVSQTTVASAATDLETSVISPHGLPCTSLGGYASRPPFLVALWPPR